VRDAGGWISILANRPNGTPDAAVASYLVRRVFEHREELIEDFSQRYGWERLPYFERHEDIGAAVRRAKNIARWSREWRAGLIPLANPQSRDSNEEIVKG
jgi:putative endonuclease